MKIKAMKASGLPIDETKLEEYKTEWRDLCDKVYKKCALDMLRTQKLLARLELVMQRKYTLVETWNVGNSQKAWRALVEKHGPIQFMAARQDNSVVAVIMDDQEVMY